MRKATFGHSTSLIVAVVATVVAAATPVDAEAQLRRISVSSNPAGTNYYAVASGVAKVLQDVTGIPSTVRPFSGSSVYIPMLQRGEVTMGINTQVDIYVAYSGGEPFNVPMSNLRLLMALVPLADNYVARADSGLESVADLEGRRVVVAI
ncbi:MAG TPA: TAXI family TRAP transporter solute-binding subunit, partial [Gammaproteobacteria bacterium]